MNDAGGQDIKGAFLIPFLIFVLFCGIPLVFLEMAVGQYTAQGGITCWTNICPLFTGIGIGGVVCLSFSIIYYNIIMTWALFYLAYSFTNDLPWATCNHTWNTANCLADTVTHNFTPGGNGFNYLNYTSPTTEFWNFFNRFVECWVKLLDTCPSSFNAIPRFDAGGRNAKYITSSQ
uniref:Uncharacterized protein n=1 Tax=Eptatretus burgeri TaxID=7764 RepID=A0A8C4QK44_EPTBU